MMLMVTGLGVKDVRAKILIETPFERKAPGKNLMAAWFRYACLKNRKGH